MEHSGKACIVLKISAQETQDPRKQACPTGAPFYTTHPIITRQKKSHKIHNFMYYHHNSSLHHIDIPVSMVWPTKPIKQTWKPKKRCATIVMVILTQLLCVFILKMTSLRKNDKVFWINKLGIFPVTITFLK